MSEPQGLFHRRSGGSRGGSWVTQALVSLPDRRSTPARELGKRILIALGILAITVAIVFIDRDSYTDSSDGVVSFVDSIYYSTVTITTTGYGDITPVTPHARLINSIIVAPLRVIFLVLLVGTTLQVLANEGRRIFRDNRWRKHMRNHVVVIGYGTKGRSAVGTLVDNGANPAQVVIIDNRPASITEANIKGYAAIEGDGTRREILRRAEIIKAREVVITLDRDDSAILVTLTVRQLNPSAHVVVAVREDDNAPLLRQSGANAVITSSEAVGRLLGLSAVSPNLGVVIEDLLSSKEGLEVGERQVTRDEVGKSSDEVRGERVVAVVRNKTLRRFYDPTVATLETGDQVVVVRHAAEEG
ncbi:potassium channel family protein [Microlunatus ginsengisoli]|uniref:Potassium channel family protein n=1 Tax=Microlunatus ginsengisoli TaxID=363863 RepID=A0ABP6ZEH3_9ACTN